MAPAEAVAAAVASAQPEPKLGAGLFQDDGVRLQMILSKNCVDISVMCDLQELVFSDEDDDGAKRKAKEPLRTSTMLIDSSEPMSQAPSQPPLKVQCFISVFCALCIKADHIFLLFFFFFSVVWQRWLFTNGVAGLVGRSGAVGSTDDRDHVGDRRRNDALAFLPRLILSHNESEEELIAL